MCLALVLLFAALPSALGAQRADSVLSRVVVTLPDDDFHPEGVAWDPRTRRLFVGSVHRGSVVVIGADGEVRPFIAPGTAGLRAIFGVLADTARGLLWVSSADVPEREGGVRSPRAPAAVIAFSLATGQFVQRWELPSDGALHVIGELMLAPDGVVWGTDSGQPALVRVPRDASATTLERVPIAHPAWRSLQGMAFRDDGHVAWLADWSTGLYHVDLTTGAVTPIVGPPGSTLRGIDGLYRVGEGHLIGIQNGPTPHRVIVIDLDPEGTTVRRVRPLDFPPGEGEPTLGVATADGFYFVSGSLWPFYDAEGRLSPGQARPRGEIRRIPWR